MRECKTKDGEENKNIRSGEVENTNCHKNKKTIRGSIPISILSVFLIIAHYVLEVIAKFQRKSWKT
jgi:hypothetical protein